MSLLCSNLCNYRYSLVQHSYGPLHIIIHIMIQKQRNERNKSLSKFFFIIFFSAYPKENQYPNKNNSHDNGNHITTFQETALHGIWKGIWKSCRQKCYSTYLIPLCSLRSWSLFSIHFRTPPMPLHCRWYPSFNEFLKNYKNIRNSLKQMVLFCRYIECIR